VPPARIYQKGYSIVLLTKVDGNWEQNHKNWPSQAGRGQNMDENLPRPWDPGAIPPYKDSQDFVRIVKDLLSKDGRPAAV